MTNKLWHTYRDKPDPNSSGICIKRPSGMCAYCQVGCYPIRRGDRWAYLVDLHIEANRAPVLQKKQDKAIAVIADVIQVLNDSWGCTTGNSTIVNDELFTKANDMLCSLITDLAIKKEIEDIKEA